MEIVGYIKMTLYLEMGKTGSKHRTRGINFIFKIAHMH